MGGLHTVFCFQFSLRSYSHPETHRDKSYMYARCICHSTCTVSGSSTWLHKQRIHIHLLHVFSYMHVSAMFYKQFYHWFHGFLYIHIIQLWCLSFRNNFNIYINHKHKCYIEMFITASLHEHWWMHSVLLRFLSTVILPASTASISINDVTIHVVNEINK